MLRAFTSTTARPLVGAATPRSVHLAALLSTTTAAAAATSSLSPSRRCSAGTALAPSAASPLSCALRCCHSNSGASASCLTARGVSIAAIRAAHDGNNSSSSAVESPSASTPEGKAAPREEVAVRARVERVRGRGKVAFLHLRQPPLESLQAVCTGKALASQAQAITPESIVDVTGVLQRPAAPIQSTTCPHCELLVTSLRLVSPAATPLPFPYRDGNTKLDTRLNHRVMDLRTERMVAITRLVSALGEAFRAELLARQFIEVHTPKLIAAASEGGSNVFTVDYFGKPAYLAQSPQLYKQMMLMGDAMRVFEIGPVFRAENSLTHRHLTEFVGLDGEMVIAESHTEVLDVLEPVMCAMLATLTTKHGALMDTLWQQQQQELPPEGESSVTVGEGTGAGGRGHALREICCEVPENIVFFLGLTSDTPLTSNADAAAAAAAPPAAVGGTDPYHARIAGGAARRVLRLAFADAARLLCDHNNTDNGATVDVMAGCALPLTDFTLPQERRLGQIIKARYGVDLYVVDLFPAEARPFYTMPLDPADPEGPTRSYDMYLRGEEICSGAQRIADVGLLEQRLAAKGVDRTTVQDYVGAFRYGAWPHGGFGLGLERIALFFLGLADIRHVSLFPRDPKRITP